jgi:asparagine synthase (glutamine-hydrolysing)
MCGIAGIWRGQLSVSGEALAASARSMTARIAHRGPDSSGEWADAAQGVAFGHLRLAIIDLSAEGHQPMHSRDGRYVLAYNGEIYNYSELRRDLEQANAELPWRGHSDTEVMLAGFVSWGVEETLRRCNGMFALALWDRQTGELILARDRIGEKPLYYGVIGDEFVFASELAALRPVLGDADEIDRQAVAALLRLGYVPDPLSILRSVRKLPPATLLVARRSPDARALRVEQREYWDLAKIAQEGIDSPLRASHGEVRERLRERLERAVQLRMVSDVPLGAFLSGGVDSSLVVALMQKFARGRVRTFSIGFENPAFDESPYAAAVARHLGTEHTEIRLAERDAWELAPRLASMYSEPFADSSQIPTALVAREARREVTVALTGDGGDELFWGYPRYRLGARLAALPVPLARAAAWMIDSLPSAATFDRFKKLAPVLDSRNACERYIELMSAFAPHGTARGGGSTLAARWSELARAGARERMAYVDQRTYLPHDMLVKVDRATMWSSLEARVPLLDPELIAFSWSVPAGLKMRAGVGKWVLRDLLYQHVPKALVDRPKAGFAVPLADWLRGPLRAWICDLLAPRAVAAHGLLDAGLAGRLLDEHLAGTRNWHAQLWTMTMLQQWMFEWKKSSNAAS